jgi:hypothetical protein
MKYIFLVTIFLSYANYSWACSFPPSSYEHKVLSAESIYIGTVTEGKIVNDADGFSHVEVMLNVHNVLKGKGVTKSTLVKTGMGHGDCGINFTIGETYIIFKEQDIDYVYTYDGTSLIGRLYEESISKEIYEILSNKVKK